MNFYLKKGKFLLCLNKKAGKVKWLEEPDETFTLMTFGAVGVAEEIGVEISLEEIKSTILNGLEGLVKDQSFVADSEQIELVPIIDKEKLH